MLHLDEKQLKAMHTRTNLRRLLDYVQSSQVEKIAKMCSKGLDPNFHCQETGGNSACAIAAAMKIAKTTQLVLKSYSVIVINCRHIPKY